MRLLIADDDSSLRTALRLVFEDVGHQVVECDSVEGARVLLSRSEADVALIDAGMRSGGAGSSGSGAETAGSGAGLWRELEEHGAFRGRVILLTGDLGALGALARHPAVLGKPFDFAEMIARIEEIGPRDGGLSALA